MTKQQTQKLINYFKGKTFDMKECFVGNLHVFGLSREINHYIDQLKNNTSSKHNKEFYYNRLQQIKTHLSYERT